MKFKPSDFYVCDEVVDGGACTREHEITLSDKECADIANARLEEMLREKANKHLGSSFEKYSAESYEELALENAALRAENEKLSKDLIMSLKWQDRAGEYLDDLNKCEALLREARKLMPSKHAPPWRL